MRSYVLPLVGGMLFVAGCAGRDARPVDAYTPYDEQMSCNAISQEIAGNNGKIHATVQELQETKGQNVAVGVAGALLFLPILFALDVSDAEKTRKCVGNIPGVDVITPEGLSVELLAPGGDAGRLTVFSEKAILNLGGE